MAVMPEDDTSDDEFDVAGYFQCIVCHQWVVEGMEVSSARMCSDCARQRHADATTARLNYEVEGRRFSMGPGNLPKVRANPEREYPPEHAMRRDAWSAAVRRLIVIHRPMFDILFAEEKARRGLNPKVKPATPPAREIAAEILAANEGEMSEAVERVRDRQEQKAT
jgi:hypothetical protein